MTQIGKYQIVDKVGEGAMGVVYRALDPVLNRPVAIKIMSEGLAQDEVLRARFLREAQAAGSLQHPNLVTIYDFGEIDGHLFIAMEFIHGIDLETLAKQGTPLPLSARIDVVIDVLNGLSYAHRRNIIHRDIKPANIRIDDDGHARIMDFGVAHLGTTTTNLTGTGMMVGTPNYMAPELISGEPVTPLADLWSVGAMLFELLTDTKPFEGETLHNVLFKIVTDDPPMVRDLKPDLPPELTAIVSKALEKSPALRYQSATEFANALAAVRTKLGQPRLSKTVSQRISIESGLQAERKKREQETTKERRIQPAAFIAAGIAAAAVVVAAAMLLRGGRPAVPAGAAPNADTTPKIAAASPPPAATQSTAPAVTPTSPVTQPLAGKSTATADQKAAVPPRTKAAAIPAPAPSRVVAQNPVTVVPTSPARGATTLAVQGAGAAAPDTTSRQPVAAPPAPVAAPASTQAASVPAPPTLENSRDAIAAVVAAYANAIGSRDLAEISRVYPRITADQRSNWKTFFGAIRSIVAKFDITSLEVTGTTALAQLSGVYEYVNSAGRIDRQPVTVHATLQRDAADWKIVSIR